MVATIDMGKFFTPGYFSLQNIFKTNEGKPAFYLTYNNYDYDDGCHWEEKEYWDEVLEDYDYRWVQVCEELPPKPSPILLDKSNYSTLISEGGRLSLALKTAPFKAIVANDELDDVDEFIYFSTGLSGTDAKTVFEKYYHP